MDSPAFPGDLLGDCNVDYSRIWRHRPSNKPGTGTGCARHDPWIRYHRCTDRNRNRRDRTLDQRTGFQPGMSALQP